jgi:ring-1,2-phenylacetyl-CoA epoxidase subunit PaaD
MVKTADLEDVMHLLEGIADPEVPVLSILDLGIVRDVQIHPAAEAGRGATEPAGAPTGVTVVITPTYVGCPAIDMIAATIRMTLAAEGYAPVDIQTTLSPPWTTDWLSDAAKNKLEAFGIAPPNPSHAVCHPDLFQRDEAVRCPHCHSYHSEMISRFGSTACKALYRCLDCKEPFDYFKCH